MTAYYTREDLLALWVDATDSSYNQPFIEKGDGGGLEVYNQAFAQYERISRAITTTTQAMFMLPWSGQTDDPASGDRYATVSLTVSRNATAPSMFLNLIPGRVILERVNDHGVQGSEEVLTGRAYATQEHVYFPPGDTSVKTTLATSTVPGYGANNPLPNTLTYWQQSGQTLNGTRAIVEPTIPRSVVTAISGGAGFVPAHVGQYLRFNAGHNQGVIRRVVSYSEATIHHGGRVSLESLVCMYLTGIVGDFTVGERVSIIPGFEGIVIFFEPATGFLAVERTMGFFFFGFGIVGESSGATGTIDSIDQRGMLTVIPCTVPVGTFELYETVNQAVSGASGMFVAYLHQSLYLRSNPGANFDLVNTLTGAVSAATSDPIGLIGYDPYLIPEPLQTAGWEFLDWELSLGLSVTNSLSPSGGKSAMLDELGLERKLPRVVGEDDDSYRNRITTLEDLVTPMALRRAIVRILDPYGIDGCFREVGQNNFRGFFYDVDPALSADSAFSYDLDFTLRPQDAWKVYLDYTSFRAFFLVGIPPTGLGDFGFAYDDHPLGAYDSSPVFTFYDGYPVTTANIQRALWNDLNTRKAAGVGFDFYLERDGCIP